MAAAPQPNTPVSPARRRREQRTRAVGRKVNWLTGLLQACSSHHTSELPVAIGDLFNVISTLQSRVKHLESLIGEPKREEEKKDTGLDEGHQDTGPRGQRSATDDERSEQETTDKCIASEEQQRTDLVSGGSGGLRVGMRVKMLCAAKSDDVQEAPLREGITGQVFAIDHEGDLDIKFDGLHRVWIHATHRHWLAVVPTT